MISNSTQLDPTFWTQESLGFEFAPGNEVVGQEETVRPLVDRHSGAFK
jgi:hypothetical protein